jgi:hypothetical protein
MSHVTSVNRPKDKRPSPRREVLEPSLAKFILDPMKGVDAVIRLRRKDAIASVLAHPEFATALKSLALNARSSAPAAVGLSRLVLNPAFSTEATAAIAANSDWPDPSKFTAPHRRLAAEALERARPNWALPWIGKALLLALPSADLRRFFASRLFLAAGGLHGTVFALANSLSALEPKAKRPSNLSALVEELLNCASPASPATAGVNAFVAFVEAIRPERYSKDNSQLMRKLGDLLLLAAAADRTLLLEEPFLSLAATLDPEVATALRADADRLFSAIVTELPPLPPRPQADLIREAAWSEADDALGRALQDSGRLLRSFERLESVVDGEAANQTRRAKGASDLVLQWVRQAARQRTITPLGSVGDRVPYDPVFHDLGDSDAAPGEVVRLVKPPIVRGTDAQRVVLIRGEVELD